LCKAAIDKQRQQYADQLVQAGPIAHLVDPEILANVDNPGTEPCSSTGLAADVVRGEAGVADVLFLTNVYTVDWDVVLVEVEQALEEGVHIAHVFLASSPTEILGDFATWRC
jgi:hypothetical protein